MGDNMARFFTEAYYLTGRDRAGKYNLQTVSGNGATARTSRKCDPVLVAGPEVFPK
jgi:hypothetical protein